MVKIAAIILAAGLSRRMGEANKLLQEWRGKPLLRHAAGHAISSKCSDVIVVTGHEAELVSNALSDLDVTIVHNPDFDTGMASSIVTGISTIENSDCSGALIALGDMPQISAADINALCDAAESNPDSVIVATNGAEWRNPVLWPRAAFSDLLQLEGDAGARALLKSGKFAVIEIELGAAAALDFDTPKAFNENA